MSVSGRSAAPGPPRSGAPPSPGPPGSGAPLASRLRALNRPRALRVRESSSGHPSALEGRRGWVDVEQVLEEWRIDDEWWRDPISRRYLCLLLSRGRRVTVFQDLLTRSWYLQEG